MSNRAVTRGALGPVGSPEWITEAVTIGQYLDDAAHVPGGHAPALVFPRSEREVADVLRASERVLVVGAQSSLTGGATPRGDVLLSTARLRTLEPLPDGRLRVGAGVTIAEVDALLSSLGALYPPGPTWPGATIGGTIATNAAGPATFKYGSTRAWVDALTVVLASGDVLDVARGTVTASDEGWFDIDTQGAMVRVPVPSYRMPDVLKLSAGYYAAPRMDLVDLFIGSEGTLGVVTEATLRVLTDRPATALVLVAFRDRARCLAFVDEVRTAARRTWRTDDPFGLDVSAIEHMDRRCLDILREDGVDVRLGITLEPEAEMALLIAVDLPAGTSTGEGYAQLMGDERGPLSALAARLGAFGLLDEAVVAMPGDLAGAERLIALREAVPVAVNQRVGTAARDVDARISKTAADIIVPADRLAELLERFDEACADHGLDGAVWGHISDGNLHPNVMPRSVEEWNAAREVMVAMGEAAIDLDGSPLAEHGVGRNPAKQALLRALYGDRAIADMRAVKRALDPRGVFARGVIFEWTD